MKRLKNKIIFSIIITIILVLPLYMQIISTINSIPLEKNIRTSADQAVEYREREWILNNDFATFYP